MEEVKMTSELGQVLESIAELKTEFKELERKVDVSNDKFDNYQRATQSLVNLAFGLIASATVITVVSSVFRR
jgi:molecular chaperone GrpE (heat shock protein)